MARGALGPMGRGGLHRCNRDADARSRENDLGEEVKARLRKEWGKLGGWRGSYPECEGLDL